MTQTTVLHQRIHAVSHFQVFLMDREEIGRAHV